MVKVTQPLPLDATGGVDISGWVSRLIGDYPNLQVDEISAVSHWMAREYPHLLEQSLELADVVADLNMDHDAVIAGLIYRGIRRQRFSEEDQLLLKNLVGSQPLAIARSVAAMATTSLLEMSNSSWLEKEQRDQVENVKRMLVAMIDDARVAVVKLAERLLALRHAKTTAQDRRLRIANEALSIFAPLAGRLGIWQLKWEMEDLSFRYTEPEQYQAIAKALKNKRAQRESQIGAMVEQVETLLSKHGVVAQTYGRAKNIYSIWRKMNHKGVEFEHVYDVRAIRVVVSTLAECYAVLGLIHTTWEHIPAEFDDYVANPKENGYQSIHTAVTASDGRTLEIQIRTQEMHEDAELGVCAHWNYKGDEDAGDSDRNYAEKMDWLRSVMEWHEELGGTQSLSSLLAHGVEQARIYVSTPMGHVLDLPSGATVLDFAYRVHTDVGHSCVGALVNGEASGLNDLLVTGDQVEIQTGAHQLPARIWLEEDMQYVTTDRARAKLVSHFRARSEAKKTVMGEDALELLCQMMGWSGLREENDSGDLVFLLDQFAAQDLDHLFARVGDAELSLFDVACAHVEHSTSSKQLPGIDDATGRFPRAARFKVTGVNRDGLLHDITSIIGRLGMDLTGTTGRVSNASGQAIITVDIELTGWRECLIFVSHLRVLRGVAQVENQSV